MALRRSVIALFLVGALLVPHIAAQKTCYQACSSDNDCLGQLACMNGQCNDDPGVGTHICGGPPPPTQGTLGGCNQACTNDNQCNGQLACMNGKCNDDPGVGTHICSKQAPPPPQGGGATCQSNGYITSPTITSDMCNTEHMSQCCTSGQKYPKYFCSPPVTAATKATLTVNGFGEGQDGGGAAACTGQFYSASEKVVALSKGWYSGGARCSRTIRITAANGKSTTATVVDECDSSAGCDEEHAYQPPCPINIVDASEAVWWALGVSPDTGMMAITWSQIN